MKKSAMLIIISFILLHSIYSETEADTFYKVEQLIRDGLNANYDNIEDLSLELNFSDRKTLYSLYDKSSGFPILMNILVPFGIGSYIQGDKRTGITLTIMDSITLTGAFVSGLMMGPYLAEYIYGYDIAQYDFSNLMIAGIVVFAVSLGIEIAAIPIRISRPIRYNRKYNDSLKQALNLDTMALKILPAARLTDKGSITPSLNFKLSY